MKTIFESSLHNTTNENGNFEVKRFGVFVSYSEFVFPTNIRFNCLLFEDFIKSQHGNICRIVAQQKKLPFIRSMLELTPNQHRTTSLKTAGIELI